MKPLLLTQVQLVSQGTTTACDLLIEHGRIARIDAAISHPTAAAMSEHVAEAYRLVDRGVAREGAFADLIAVDLHRPWQVEARNLAYPCGWSPFEGQQFTSQIRHTFTNGVPVVLNGQLTGERAPMRLEFEPLR